MVSGCVRYDRGYTSAKKSVSSHRVWSIIYATNVTFLRKNDYLEILQHTKVKRNEFGSKNENKFKTGRRVHYKKENWYPFQLAKLFVLCHLERLPIIPRRRVSLSIKKVIYRFSCATIFVCCCSRYARYYFLYSLSLTIVFRVRN